MAANDEVNHGALFDAACAAAVPVHAFVNTAFVLHEMEEEVSAVQVAICHRANADSPWMMEEEFAEPVREALEGAGFCAEAENCMAILNRPAESVVNLLTSWGMVQVAMDEL
jgi:hypothetical protein